MLQRRSYRARRPENRKSGNMPAEVLMRKVKGAVMQKNKPVEDKTFSSITRFLAAELLDDGNVALWANGNDEHDWQKSERDAFESLEELPFWNQDIAAGFANHVTGPYKTYAVEVKSITVEMIGLGYRKRKAVVIMKLVQGNVMAIPSLHIDNVKDISFSCRTTDDERRYLSARA